MTARFDGAAARYGPPGVAKEAHTMRKLLAAVAVLALGAASSRAAAVRFTAPPTAERDGTAVRIRFAVSGPTDVEVSVLGSDGKVVRHLAAGVLGGANAPPLPLKPGLTQTIVWDGRDDADREAVGRPFRVRVGLGLAHRLDRIIGWDARAIQKIYSLAVGPDGELCVLWAQPDGVAGPPQVAVLSRDGPYARAIVPYPATMPREKLGGIDPIRLPDGGVLPRVHHGFASTFYPWLSGVCRQTMAVTSQGKLVMTTGQFNYSTVGSTGPRRLLVVNTDGSCPESFAGPVLDKRQWAGRPVEGTAHLAATPDGETVYAAGLYETHDWSREHLPSHVVLRARLSGGPQGEAEVFFGERGKPGDDQDHLNDPRGLAVDADGRLLVADHGNNRIVKLDSVGKFLGQIAVAQPDQIAVNRKTGAIYVVSVDHGDHGPGHVRGWQKKRLIKLRSWAEPKPAAVLEGPLLNALEAMTIAVDDRVAPAVVWVALAHPSTYHGSGQGLFRCLDEGDSFSPPQPVLGPATGAAGLSACEYIAVDPVSERIHVRADAANSARAWRVFDGRTGRAIDSPRPRPLGEERAFDRQGRLYLFGAGSKNTVIRLNADGSPAPFEATGTHTVDLPGGLKARPRGFAVAPSGDIYVLHYPGDPWKPDGARTTLTVVGADGTIKQTDVLIAMRTAASVRVDRAGNIYLADNIKIPAEPFPAELGVTPAPTGRIWGVHYEHAAWYPWLYGSVAKFGPDGGRIEQVEGGRYLTGWPGWYKDGGAVKVTGAHWIRPGMAPVPAVEQTCVCGSGRFDLDRFDRIYVPDAARCRVNVFDASGNLLGHFGGYGNMDSAGPGSAIPTPEIPLAWPACVSASPQAIYVADRLNLRVVRVRPSHAIEADCTLD